MMLYSFPGRAGMKPPTLHPLRSIITRFELFVKGTETKNREVPLFLRRGGVGSVGEAERIPERQKRKRILPLSGHAKFCQKT